MGSTFLLTLLGVGWVLWATFHSLLIWPPVQNRLESLLGPASICYRLFYNVTASLTLLPLLWLEHRWSAELFFNWSGDFFWLRLILMGLGLGLLVAGLTIYPLGDFLGLTSLKKQSSSEKEILIVRGVSRFVRHPWYLAAFFLLWSRPLTPGTLITNGVLTLYLGVGAKLEEHKLVERFGQSYLNYQRSVPMFIPQWPKSDRRD